MQAVILAGGLGTRLRPFTVTIPKPLLPLGDQPVVDVLLGQLREEGFDRVHMCLGYMAPLFQAFLGDGSRYGLKVDYIVEEQPLGTAGALLRLGDLDSDFLVMNGDTLTTISFGDLIESHIEADAYGTIFSAKIDEYVDYGLVEFDPQTKLLVKYTEKPTRHYHVSTGIYALSRRILNFAKPSPEGRLDMPDLLRSTRNAGHPILCYTEEGAYWRDIGRFDHYEAASKDFLNDASRFKGSRRNGREQA
jgi:NDP-sugar pyrophosphorylase family protein